MLQIKQLDHILLGKYGKLTHFFQTYDHRKLIKSMRPSISTLSHSLTLFKLSTTHGFLVSSFPPSVPTFSELLPHYEIVKSLNLKDHNIFDSIKNLPELDHTIFSNDYEQLELATLIHGMLVSAYYWNSEIPNIRIPQNIGVPYYNFSKMLERPPILNTASIQMHNFKFIDLKTNFHPDNLECIFTFSGTRDEEYFYLIPTYIEYLGNPIIDAAFILFEGIDNENDSNVKQALKIFDITIRKMRIALSLNYTRVNPKIFYHDFRPKLKSYEKGVIFEGISENKHFYQGSSAAQSPIIKLIDAVFELNRSNTYIVEMLKYLKREHRSFIESIDMIRPHNLREKIIKLGAQEEWNKVVDEICRFRESHMRLAIHYINLPSQGKEHTGTGGTSIDQFLNNLIENTKKIKI